MSFHERLAAALAAGTSEHYEDAALYDHEYKRRRDDVRWYRALAEKGARQPAARRRSSSSAAARAARSCRSRATAGASSASTPRRRCSTAARRGSRACRDARVELVRADFRTLALGRRFPLVICPFNAFMHLYTREDVERFLAVVRAHLAPGRALRLRRA